MILQIQGKWKWQFHEYFMEYLVEYLFYIRYD